MDLSAFTGRRSRSSNEEEEKDDGSVASTSAFSHFIVSSSGSVASENDDDTLTAQHPRTPQPGSSGASILDTISAAISNVVIRGDPHPPAPPSTPASIVLGNDNVPLLGDHLAVSPQSESGSVTLDSGSTAFTDTANDGAGITGSIASEGDENNNVGEPTQPTPPQGASSNYGAVGDVTHGLPRIPPPPGFKALPDNPGWIHIPPAPGFAEEYAAVVAQLPTLSEGSYESVRMINETQREMREETYKITKRDINVPEEAFMFWTETDYGLVKEIIRLVPELYPKITKFQLAENPDPEYSRAKFRELDELYEKSKRARNELKWREQLEKTKTVLGLAPPDQTSHWPWNVPAGPIDPSSDEDDDNDDNFPDQPPCPTPSSSAAGATPTSTVDSAAPAIATATAADEPLFSIGTSDNRSQAQQRPRSKDKKWETKKHAQLAPGQQKSQPPRQADNSANVSTSLPSSASTASSVVNWPAQPMVWQGQGQRLYETPPWQYHIWQAYNPDQRSHFQAWVNSYYPYPPPPPPPPPPPEQARMFEGSNFPHPTWPLYFGHPCFNPPGPMMFPPVMPRPPPPAFFQRPTVTTATRPYMKTDKTKKGKPGNGAGRGNRNPRTSSDTTLGRTETNVEQEGAAAIYKPE